MGISEKIGSLPKLGWIYDLGPLGSPIALILINLGMVYALMWFEWYRGGLSPHERPYYNAQLWGDLIFLPLCMASAVAILQEAPAEDDFYTGFWWHTLLLTIGVVLSVCVEVGAVRGGQYTFAQEISPSKLWHTAIFGVVFYWLFAALVPVATNFTLVPLASLGILVGAVGFVAMNILDWRDLARDPMSKTNVHMELHFNPFAFQPRGGYFRSR